MRRTTCNLQRTACSGLRASLAKPSVLLASAGTLAAALIGTQLLAGSCIAIYDPGNHIHPRRHVGPRRWNKNSSEARTMRMQHTGGAGRSYARRHVWGMLLGARAGLPGQWMNFLDSYGWSSRLTRALTRRHARMGL